MNNAVVGKALRITGIIFLVAVGIAMLWTLIQFGQALGQLLMLYVVLRIFMWIVEIFVELFKSLFGFA
ncbi:hypothetical protein [Deinococcus yavapaiensis]|uniref:Uncharacterized protein n=1 Tax=Deinococcus yavapaiensis KR-236 TaxID=694435 RepID=A0A318SEN6_9DEIO|nr:hypothetical protein [Deinococcus yavapaiensis]PYE55002.1 hypothetical protein DES52_104276 [Deinococcus yavapaiensis KR-236]